jgi:hypothetical protein
MAKSTVTRPATLRQTRLPLIIEYTNLLHKYRDPNAPEVQTFLRQHPDDETFLKRAQVLNKVFKLKAELTQPGS